MREVLDHILGLVAAAPLGDSLVLRGSMTMPAWVGDAARPPGDLDWVVRPPDLVPVDDLAPWPFPDHLGPVQHWPEAVHGGARNQMWAFEEFETGGQHPRLPPEGLRWVTAEELDEDVGRQVHHDLSCLVAGSPRTPGGVLLDAEEIEVDTDWSYSGYWSGFEGGGGARLRVPWQAAGGATGTVQLDFAYDERLPEPPVLTAVPRAGGLAPVPVWTAGRELSLAWKLRWLAADQLIDRVSAGKDLYDAVLLATLDGLRLSPRLRSVALDTPGGADLLDPAAIRGWTIDSGDEAVPWLERLAEAAPRLLTDEGNKR